MDRQKIARELIAMARDLVASSRTAGASDIDEIFSAVVGIRIKADTTDQAINFQNDHDNWTMVAGPGVNLNREFLKSEAGAGYFRAEVASLSKKFMQELVSVQKKAARLHY